MKRVCAAIALVLLSSSAEAVPVTWTFTGVADSGQWNGSPLAGLAYELRLSKDIDPADFDLGDWNNLSAEIDIATLGTHTFASCQTSSPASCVTAPFQFLETFSVANADRFHFRGPQGLGDSVVNVPLGALGPDAEVLSAVGPLQTLSNGTSHILARDSTPSQAIVPDFELMDTDAPGAPITALVTIGGATAVPEGGSSLVFLALGAASLVAARRFRVTVS